MIRSNIRGKTSIEINKSVEGETIEQKMQRVESNKEPIEDSAPIIYQPRGEGVNAAYDIRADRFEMAAEAMDMVTASKLAKRNSFTNPENKEESAGAEPTQGTNN